MQYYIKRRSYVRAQSSYDPSRDVPSVALNFTEALKTTQLKGRKPLNKTEFEKKNQFHSSPHVHASNTKSEYIKRAISSAYLSRVDWVIKSLVQLLIQNLNAVQPRNIYHTNCHHFLKLQQNNFYTFSLHSYITTRSTFDPFDFVEISMDSMLWLSTN